MVVKPSPTTKSTTEVFESRVILDGSQTLVLVRTFGVEFESRVILDGSQTHGLLILILIIV